jgi:hypothetical protein
MSDHYIERADIKDRIIEGFDLSEYLTETNAQLQDLAESLGVDSTDIETDPLHNTIKRFCVVYTVMRLCQDKAGANNVEISESEKYAFKYQVYRKEFEDLRGRISAEMICGQVSSIRDRATNTGTLYRG